MMTIEHIFLNLSKVSNIEKFEKWAQWVRKLIFSLQRWPLSFLLFFLFSILYQSVCADIKAIVFDCDGTLVDSEYAHFTAWRKTLLKYKYDFKLEDWHQFAGKGDIFIADFYSQKLAQNIKSELLAYKKSIYSDMQLAGFPPIKSTVDFACLLAQEKERLGIKLAVASAGRREETIKSLRSIGILDYFDVILSGQDDLDDYHDPEGNNKPKPYIYLHAAKLMNLDPHECVAIEDSHTGVMAAFRAGYIVIAVPNMFTNQHDFSNADMVLKSLSNFSINEFITYMQKHQKNRLSIP
jgi:beta-phosphoglucomutase